MLKPDGWGWVDNLNIRTVPSNLIAEDISTCILEILQEVGAYHGRQYAEATVAIVAEKVKNGQWQ